MNASALLNRSSPLLLPLIGMFTLTLKLFIDAHEKWTDSVEVAMLIGLGGGMWIPMVVGVLLLLCDVFFPKKRKLILGVYLACAATVGVLGWMVGEWIRDL